jgi:hypothetical protein
MPGRSNGGQGRKRAVVPQKKKKKYTNYVKGMISFAVLTQNDFNGWIL